MQLPRSPQDGEASSIRLRDPGHLDPHAATDNFPRRHLGSTDEEVAAMLKTIGLESMEALVDRAVPQAIRLRQPLNIPAAQGEHEALEELRALGKCNQVRKSFLGQGYYDCI